MNVGEITISIPSAGMDPCSMQRKSKKDPNWTFTSKAKRAHQRNEAKFATYKINITDIAFKANGGDSKSYHNWVVSLVADVLELKSDKDIKFYQYKVTPYHEIVKELGSKNI